MTRFVVMGWVGFWERVISGFGIQELSRAILEATNMNPNLNVEKVDYKRETGQ